MPNEIYSPSFLKNFSLFIVEFFLFYLTYKDSFFLAVFVFYCQVGIKKRCPRSITSGLSRNGCVFYSKSGVSV